MQLGYLKSLTWTDETRTPATLTVCGCIRHSQLQLGHVAKCPLTLNMALVNNTSKEKLFSKQSVCLFEQCMMGGSFYVGQLLAGRAG